MSLSLATEVVITRVENEQLKKQALIADSQAQKLAQIETRAQNRERVSLEMSSTDRLEDLRRVQEAVALASQSGVPSGVTNATDPGAIRAHVLAATRLR
jgi:hypothetical protein